MPASIDFTNTSPRYKLPFLFAGQAQKEFTVNHAFALTDMLLHACVESVADIPPANAIDGQVWLIGEAASGEWAERTGTLAGREAGVWIYLEPRDGFRIYDREAGQELLYANGWQRPVAPTAPQGGTTIDMEARAAFTALVEALKECGVFPRN